MSINLTEYYTNFEIALKELDSKESKDSKEDKECNQFKAQLINLAALGKTLESLPESQQQELMGRMHTLTTQYLNLNFAINSNKRSQLALVYYKHLCFFKDVKSPQPFLDVRLLNDKDKTTKKVLSDQWRDKIYQYRQAHGKDHQELLTVGASPKVEPRALPPKTQSTSSWGFGFTSLIGSFSSGFSAKDIEKRKQEVGLENDIDLANDLVLENEILSLLGQKWPESLFKSLSVFCKNTYNLDLPTFEFFRNPVDDSAPKLINIGSELRAKDPDYVPRALRTAITIHEAFSYSLQETLEARHALQVAAVESETQKKWSFAQKEQDLTQRKLILLERGRALWEERSTFEKELSAALERKLGLANKRESHVQQLREKERITLPPPNNQNPAAYTAAVMTAVTTMTKTIEANVSVESKFKDEIRSSESPLKLEPIKSRLATIDEKLNQSRESIKCLLTEEDGLKQAKKKLEDELLKDKEAYHSKEAHLQTKFEGLHCLSKLVLLLFCSEQQYYIFQLKLNHDGNRDAYFDIIDKIQMALEGAVKLFHDSEMAAKLTLVRSDVISNTQKIKDKLIDYSTYVPHTDSPLAENHDASLFHMYLQSNRFSRSVQKDATLPASSFSRQAVPILSDSMLLGDHFGSRVISLQAPSQSSTRLNVSGEQSVGLSSNSVSNSVAASVPQSTLVSAGNSTSAESAGSTHASNPPVVRMLNMGNSVVQSPSVSVVAQRQADSAKP